MEDITRWSKADDEDIYALPGPDTLGVLSSTRTVVEQGELVWINIEQVEHLAEQWHKSAQLTPLTPVWHDQYHFFDSTERTVNWLLVLDALNFSFWPERDQPRWSINYKGKILDGYWAEAAALTRAVEEGIPLYDAEYLSTISYDVMNSIFRSNTAAPIPLLEQRVQNAQEVGRVLLTHYDGQFARAIEQVQGSAVKLALLLAQQFPSFHDVAQYHGHEVCFYKRAQICVADLYGSFGGKQWGKFTDLAQLTIFADYKIPQVLRHYGIVEYHPQLAERIDNQEHIEAGSEEEIEIRTATVWACELLRRALLQHSSLMNAIEIDLKLWLLGQSTADMHPYHRTRTVYY